MASTYTTNIGLQKPEHRDPDTYYNWDVVCNGNSDILDSYLGAKSYTEQNYISNSDALTLSLNKLDVQLKDVSDVAPTVDEKAALAGISGQTPSAANPYVTLNYLLGGPSEVDKKHVLFPEFAGGTFALTPGGLNTGTMITNSEVVSSAGLNYRFNYYQWESAETADLHKYDIVVQWKVPSTFDSWTTTGYKALIIDFKTQINDPGECYVDVELTKDGSNLTSPYTGYSSGGVWFAEKLGNESIRVDRSDAILSTIVAGDTLNIRITLASRDNYYVRIGGITLQYVGLE